MQKYHDEPKQYKGYLKSALVASANGQNVLQLANLAADRSFRTGEVPCTSGGTKTTAELIAECERGILVTRLYYIRPLDPQTVLQTGLTRDGTFLIEGGRITRALKNFRWNESPLLMLSHLEAGRMMPALRVREFSFESASDAI